MEVYKIQNLSFTYPNRNKRAVDNISLSINSGEFITLCGKSGCGKTTLLRLLKPSLSPFGDTKGEIYFKDLSLSSLSSRDDAAKIGFVMQSPDNQIATDKVWHELAFGLESLGYSTSEIRARVSEMASFFGIQNWFHKKVSELSGGQKQLLNLASVMIMQPDILILDEPTSQLDPIAVAEFLRIVRRINQDLGTTIILSEHRLEDAILVSDRVIVMEDGKIIADCPPRQIGDELRSVNSEMFVALPAPIQIHSAIKCNLPCPLTTGEGRLWLTEYSKTNPLNKGAIPVIKAKNFKETVVSIKDAYFRYEKDVPDVIKGLNLEIFRGEFFAIVGGNATGKTTALSLISGLNIPYRGKVLINGESVSKIPHLYDGILGVLPQNPQSLFVKNTVYLDLLEMLTDTDIPKEEKNKQIKSIAALCQIDNLLDFHPYDLSGGEQQRAALAKILLKSPQILLLDEPTKGLDACFKQEFADIISNLKSKGTTVIMVSHDIEFCAKFADRCAIFFDGSITSSGHPREFFCGKAFYTTAANKMARGILPGAILAEDIILACRGSLQENEQPPSISDNPSGTKEPEHIIAKRDSASKTIPIKKTIIGILLILLAIPLTIFAGSILLQDRKYYFTSIMIILETIFAFFLSFESGKPRARELVIISVLCALAIAGRSVFYMVPQFKPVAAIVIVAGICFGGEAGFLVGAITAFVSNFFFGQGPWTPWQMVAFGLIGFISGLLFKKSKSINIPMLCIFGFLATLIIYGGIVNPASVIMMQGEPSLSMIIASYAAGFPFDIIHSISTAFFLALIGRPMIEKLERVKTKFGI